VRGPASPYLQGRGSTSDAYFTEPATPLFPFGFGLSYSTFAIKSPELNPNPSAHVFNANDTFTISGQIASTGPAGKLTLLLFFSQNAPTKWARFERALAGFGKFAVPADSTGTAFSFSASVRDFDAYEPATSDYEVYTGTYTVWLATDATAAPLASWTLKVQGSYSWVWDFSH